MVSTAVVVSNYPATRINEFSAKGKLQEKEILIKSYFASLFQNPMSAIQRRFDSVESAIVADVTPEIVFNLYDENREVAGKLLIIQPLERKNVQTLIEDMIKDLGEVADVTPKELRMACLFQLCRAKVIAETKDVKLFLKKNDGTFIPVLGDITTVSNIKAPKFKLDLRESNRTPTGKEKYLGEAALKTSNAIWAIHDITSVTAPQALIVIDSIDDNFLD